MKCLWLLSYAVVACRLLSAADDAAPQLIRKVDPNQGLPKVGLLFGTAEVQLTVDQTGTPFSFDSSQPLPDYVVKALAEWRYSPYKKDGKPVAFAISVSVPVSRPITPGMELHFVPRWRPESTEIRDALAQGEKLDEGSAAALEAKLPDAEALGNPRTSLLVYYAKHAAADTERVRAARAKLLTWLVAHYPQDEILGSPYALVNRLGEPLADAATCHQLTQLWLDAVKQYPTDESVTAHALNFLQVANPPEAVAILNKLPRWKGRGRWAADLYGLEALGVTALDPQSGNAVAVADLPAKAAVRNALLNAQDTQILLGGLWAMTNAARSLTAANAQVPPDYETFCQSLLNRAKEVYPETTQSCDVSARPSDNTEQAIPQVFIGGKVAETHLIKKVQPAYPAEAKQHFVQGTVRFTAIIGKAGIITDLEARSSPFALYAASAEAVRQWRYKPTLLNGKPVEIVTDIVVNFALGSR